MSKRTRPPDSYEASQYTEGMCAFYAIALNEVTGWPIVGLVMEGNQHKIDFAEHFMVRSPSGEFVDVTGAYDQPPAKWNHHGHTAVPVRFSRRDIIRAYQDVGDDDDIEAAIAEARRDIARAGWEWS